MKHHDEVQENALSNAKLTRKQFNKKKLIIFIVALVVSSLIVLDYLFPPLWWQFEAQANKKAIMEYANVNYPQAEIIDYYFESTRLNPCGSKIDSIHFKWKDVDFSVLAEKGKVIRDNYWFGVAYNKVYNMLVAPFFEPRNLNIGCEIYASELAAFLSDAPNSDMSNFSGYGTQVIIHSDFIDGENALQSLQWVYDYYLFCKNSFSFLDYRITLIFPSKGGDYFIHFTQNSIFNSKDDFYSSFLFG